MKKYIPVDAKEDGQCFLCVGKNSGTKKVIVMEDGTEICLNHYYALLKNGKKEDAPLFDRKTA